MRNNEILNGVASLRYALEAYQTLYDDVLDRTVFEQEAKKVLSLLCSQNPSLMSGSSICNDDGFSTSELGMCGMPMPQVPGLAEVLMEKLPRYVRGGAIVVPVKMDFGRCFAMALAVENQAEQASTLAQYILLSALQQNSRLNFRCADLVKGGSFFSVLHNLVTNFPGKTGGKVYMTAMELDGLLRELEEKSAKTIAALGSSFGSVYDYNQSGATKLEEYVNIIYLPDMERQDDITKRLRILLENRKKNGMSFILVGNRDAVEGFADIAEYYIRYHDQGAFMGSKAQLPFAVSPMVKISDAQASVLGQGIQQAEKVDTIYANNPQLHTPYLSMDSTQALRIPFALDKNGQVQYFEIGGEAPSHALLSGSTGSGKSVALHTLIMQTIHNYHPDDVEIWAIDYKAVEFDWYIQHKAPHFRVIAHDTSVEFSLSLLDLLDKEYNDRMEKFLNAGVKNISEYRKKMGPHSMPRIVVFIDEFQIMTQAVQTYSGNKDYRTVLENLLKLTRAMGISFVLCSQTIASGLSGLTESARDQIGCRLCLKHDDDNEIRETLMLSGPDSGPVVAKAKELRKGQGIYKRARWAGEHAPDGKSYEYLSSHILYISDEIKDQMIQQVSALVAGSCTPKEEIFVRGGGRIALTEKPRHPMQKFLEEDYEPDEDCLEWYPAAPTTLADYYRVKLENTAGANILMVGENDELRESVVLHSLCGFLMDPMNKVVVSIIDENYSDRKSMVQLLQKITSRRLVLNIGIEKSLSVIRKLKKIRPAACGHTIYVWYGLDKVKNEIFLLHQDDEDEEEIAAAPAAPATRQEMIDDVMSFFASINASSTPAAPAADSADLDLTYDDCKSILRQAFEVGPENNMYHLAIFNNYKSLKKSGMIDLDCFENRVGTRMSVDDSYELFGSSMAIGKTDDNTVIYYAGSGQPTPLRPYLLPDESWYEQFGEMVR